MIYLLKLRQIFSFCVWLINQIGSVVVWVPDENWFLFIFEMRYICCLLLLSTFHNYVYKVFAWILINVFLKIIVLIYVHIILMIFELLFKQLDFTFVFYFAYFRLALLSIRSFEQMTTTHKDRHTWLILSWCCIILNIIWFIKYLFISALFSVLVFYSFYNVTSFENWIWACSYPQFWFIVILIRRCLLLFEKIILHQTRLFSWEFCFHFFSGLNFILKCSLNNWNFTRKMFLLFNQTRFRYKLQFLCSHIIKGPHLIVKWCFRLF